MRVCYLVNDRWCLASVRLRQMKYPHVIVYQRKAFVRYRRYPSGHWEYQWANALALPSPDAEVVVLRERATEDRAKSSPESRRRRR